MYVCKYRHTCDVYIYIYTHLFIDGFDCVFTILRTPTSHVAVQGHTHACLI